MDKKLILLGVIAILVTSCKEEESTNVPVTTVPVTSIDGVEYKIYEVDGCEYIGNNVGCTYGFFTHKGNCKYCAKRNKNK